MSWRQKLTPEARQKYRARLGTVPDSWIADWMGVDRFVVGKWRKAEGVERYRLHIDLQRLGTVPDLQLATEMGCSQEYIRQHRARLGIEAYGHRVLRERRQESAEAIRKAPARHRARLVRLHKSHPLAALREARSLSGGGDEREA